MDEFKATVTLEIELLEGVTFSSVKREVLSKIMGKLPSEWFVTVSHVKVTRVERELDEPEPSLEQEEDLESLDDWHPDIVGGRL